MQKPIRIELNFSFSNLSLWHKLAISILKTLSCSIKNFMINEENYVGICMEKSNRIWRIILTVLQNYGYPNVKPQKCSLSIPKITHVTLFLYIRPCGAAINIIIKPNFISMSCIYDYMSTCILQFFSFCLFPDIIICIIITIQPSVWFRLFYISSIEKIHINRGETERIKLYWLKISAKFQKTETKSLSLDGVFLCNV